ncbi:preprotein translocase subunit SecY [Bradyrhizobium guangdongense]|uniref:preprotein translocase subunit SecY n=1 Tax=Bradyrhizobium guangdongense TaxID=1325090 RepID=UPI0011292976|nr:preprotein translocase subunit SecY [Bradyrhizobium guangdongense]TPQ28040.1 preprotein translocase subunit SecY [Bradyrhizobium guangdongense]
MTRELARRIAFTIGALLLFRFGTHVLLPGLRPGDWLTGGPAAIGAITRLSIICLNLIPYLSAAILVQLVAMAWGRLNSLARSGERGRRRIARYTLILTLLIASFQAYGIATALRDIPNVVPNPDGGFVLTATVSMVGGVFFLVWLSELITRHGIGNGIALILSVNIIVSLPSDIAGIASLLQSGAISSGLVLGHIAFWIATVTIMVVVESARRNVRVDFAGRKIGDRVLPARSAVLPIKINSAGYLVPTTVAPWLWFLPLAVLTYVYGADAPLIESAYKQLKFGAPLHMILGSAAVFVLAFIYTAYVVDPEHTAKSLIRYGGAVPGVVPGEATADQIDRVASLTTVVGAVYLTSVLLIPEVFELYGIGLPYSMIINGGAALIVVCTVLDLRKQVRDLSLTNAGDERR